MGRYCFAHALCSSLQLMLKFELPDILMSLTRNMLTVVDGKLSIEIEKYQNSREVHHGEDTIDYLYFNVNVKFQGKSIFKTQTNEFALFVENGSYVFHGRFAGEKESDQRHRWNNKIQFFKVNKDGMFRTMEPISCTDCKTDRLATEGCDKCLFMDSAVLEKRAMKLQVA